MTTKIRLEIARQKRRQLASVVRRCPFKVKSKFQIILYGASSNPCAAGAPARFGAAELWLRRTPNTGSIRCSDGFNRLVSVRIRRVCLSLSRAKSAVFA
eukprot:scaffold873_cov252-Pinguiococcus_pyrenoidosus.AAC.5